MRSINTGYKLYHGIRWCLLHYLVFEYRNMSEKLAMYSFLNWSFINFEIYQTAKVLYGICITEIELGIKWGIINTVENLLEMRGIVWNVYRSHKDDKKYFHKLGITMGIDFCASKWEVLWISQSDRSSKRVVVSASRNLKLLCEKGRPNAYVQHRTGLRF